MQSRIINQSQLTGECWAIQFDGVKACVMCEVKGTKDCGGKNIIKKGVNSKGYKVPLGEVYE